MSCSQAYGFAWEGVRFQARRPGGEGTKATVRDTEGVKSL